MENATKTLLIASAILIVIVLISLGVILLESVGNMSSQPRETSDVLKEGTYMQVQSISSVLEKEDNILIIKYNGVYLKIKYESKDQKWSDFIKGKTPVITKNSYKAYYKIGQDNENEYWFGNFVGPNLASIFLVREGVIINCKSLIEMRCTIDDYIERFGSGK